MAVTFAYINVKGVNGDIYSISNFNDKDVLARLLKVNRGDFFDIKGLGVLSICDWDSRTTFIQGVEQTFIFIDVKKI